MLFIIIMIFPMGAIFAENPESIQEIGDAIVKMVGEIEKYSPVDIREFIEQKFGFEKYSQQVLGCYEKGLAL